MDTGYKTCVRCGRTFFEDAATALVDSICPDCAIEEALDRARRQDAKWDRVSVQLIKARFRPGMRIRLIRMSDVQAPPPGTEGTVRGVDDIGSVLVAWDNGSGLNVIPGEDQIEIIGDGPAFAD